MFRLFHSTWNYSNYSLELFQGAVVCREGVGRGAMVAWLDLRGSGLLVLGVLATVPFDTRPARAVDEIQLYNGEIAEVGQILYRIGVPKPLRIVAEVNEEDIPRVVIGQKTLLRTDAFPNQALDGSVSEITPTRSATT